MHMSKERLEPMTGCGILGILKGITGIEGCYSLIHGPVSCSSGHRLAMLFAEKEPILPTTNVTDIDIVLGSMDRLSAALDKVWELYHPKLLVIILTCATSIVGEDFSLVIEEYENKTGSKALILDGSALAGDEVSAIYEAYEAILEKFNEKDVEKNRNLIALDGITITDYNFKLFYNICKELVLENCNIELAPSIFADLDLDNNLEEYLSAEKVPVGLLWNKNKRQCPAPYGANGTYDFLKWVCEETGHTISLEASAKKEKYNSIIEPLADIIKGSNIKVAIESSGWHGYGLARFLKQELGCKVLLCVDSDSNVMDYTEVCDDFYVDVGRYELVSIIEDFGASLVFGSSNIQDNKKWKWIPFFQPVWHVVEKEECYAGYDGAIKLADFIIENFINSNERSK